jgi:hypothetical protein
MATKKKTAYSEIELLWAEEQLATWKTYVDANPLDKLKERVVWKEVRGGGQMPIVSETIGQQIKTLTELMKNYLALLKEVEIMREKEEEKQKSVRGHQALSPAEAGII